MSRYFIAEIMFEHQIDCFCPDAGHADVVTISKGDIMEVTNERRYIDDFGWYFLIFINKSRDFFIAIEDLEHYFKCGYILSLVDLDLKVNYLQFKIDQTLEKGDEESFLQHTKKLTEANKNKSKLEIYVQRSKENLFI